MIYVTYSVPFFFKETEKYAVECRSEDEAMEVALDANSLVSIKNIRFRRCGKPVGRRVMSYEEYFGKFI